MASNFKLFEHAKPKTSYRNFVEGTAQIAITSDKIKVTFGKKSFNPLIMDWVASLSEIKVPWMNNRIIEYAFT